MTPTDIAIPVGLLTLLTFLQTLVPSVLLWNTSKFDEGTTPTGKDGMGPRDRIPVATTTVARLERAKANLIESLVMFSPALAIALFAGAGSLMLIGI